MAQNRTHHASKSNRFTVVFAREEDAANARSFRLARWQIALSVVCGVALIGGAFYALVTLTPLAEFVPLPNPALENKYSRELLALNRRVLTVMEELVKLRTYNVKLRNALGDQVKMTDSGAVVELPTNIERALRKEQPVFPPVRVTVNDEGGMMPRAVPIIPVNVPVPAGSVAFPAVLPSQGYVTRGFGSETNHYGLDIAGKVGSIVSAAADGTVLFSGWTPEDGSLILIAHAGGFVTVYKHNQSLLRPANARVRRGEPIALLGDSGRTSLGPHVHFEIWKDGVPVDPALYVINLAL